MSLAIQSVTPAVAALAADLGIALQPGTVVDARVLQILDANLVRIAIASLTLDVPTAKPLQAGQTLQLAVAQSATGISLTPVTDDAPALVPAAARGAAVIVDDIPLAPRAPNQPAPVEPALTPQEARVVLVAAQAAVTKQAGLSPLFANLSVAVASGVLPQPVLIAAAQLLGLRLPSAAKLTGEDIKAALQSSGLTMEAALASPSANIPPNIKSTLLVLRQALVTWLGPQPDVAAPAQGTNIQGTSVQKINVQIANAPVVQANVVLPDPSEPSSQPIVRAPNVQIAAALQALGVSTEGAEPLAAPRNLLAAQLLANILHPRVDVETQRQPSLHAVPPPVRGNPPVPQSVATSTLAPDAAPPAIARELIAETDSALARQTLLQIASLPDRTDAPTLRSEASQPRWNFEIPFVTPQGTAMAQFEIARDGGGNGRDASQRIWRARFSLDIEPAGAVHALIAFSGDTTSVRMWAERPATAAQLRANASQLTQSLDRAALKAGDIVVADGAPSRAKIASGHFLNRAT